MVFKVPSNKNHSVILWSWLWRMFTHIAFFASKSWCIGPINKLTTSTTPLGCQHNPQCEGVTRFFFLLIILNKACVGAGEAWTSGYCKFVGAVMISQIFLEQRKLPLWDLYKLLWYLMLPPLPFLFPPHLPLMVSQVLFGQLIHRGLLIPHWNQSQQVSSFFTWAYCVHKDW